AVATVQIPLSAPLTSWRLQYFVDQRQLDTGGSSAYFNLFSALAVAAMALTGLAFYFYRESSRELREANTRVNFVNQISHELKTPLTNIRMYADLLEHDLQSLDDAAAEDARKRLNVIIGESGRLSRLIGNVLTFATLRRGPVTLRKQMGKIDDLIASVLQIFHPAMHHKGIHVTFNGDAKQTVEFDSDCVEQILVNLLSNAEKYAAIGKSVEISTSQQLDRTTILVADNGPGIDAQVREKVFQPFFRGATGLEDVAGAGIGLGIARTLARMHGGDVRLLTTSHGAIFQVDLHTLAQQGESP
ncbi:MAG: HAMP domain-containing histidine kinase, partial [Planctomycetales bacterium]